LWHDFQELWRAQQMQPRDFLEIGFGGSAAALVNAVFFGHGDGLSVS
jgi:hypothetical protein